MMHSLCLIVVAFAAMHELEASVSYLRDNSVGMIFEHLFLGRNSDVLSVFPQCLLKSSTPDATEVTIEPLVWTELQYETELRKRRISALNVSLEMSITQLRDVNERDRKVTLTVRTVTRWDDCRLSWSQQQFNKVSNITVSPSRFRMIDMFVPQVTLLEQTDPFAAQASETEIRITSQGRIHIDRLYTTTISCSLDVEMYPFDSHNCNLTMETLFNSLEVNLEIPPEASTEEASSHLLADGRYVVSDTFVIAVLPPLKSRRWICTDIAFVGQSELDNLHCFTDRLTFRLLLRRNPRFYILHLFIPAFLCLLCSAVVFIITPGFADKVFPSSFTMVSVLTFITATYAEMPETGSTLSWMSKFYFMCIFIVCLNCIYSSISSIMASSKLPVPSSMKRMVESCSAIILFDIVPKRSRKSTLRKAASTSVEMKPLNTADQEEQTNFKQHEELLITWRHVAACFDRFYFLILFPGSIATFVAFIMHGLNATAHAFQRFTNDAEWPYVEEQLKIQTALAMRL